MTDNSTTTPGEPRVETGMLIRKPAADVFAAFVEPAITTRFWFTSGSGRLEPGAQVRWTGRCTAFSRWSA